MAKKRGKDDDASVGKGQHSRWVRIGGAVGDEAMQEQADYNQSGAGVELNIKAVGSDPNADVASSEKRPGSEL